LSASRTHSRPWSNIRELQEAFKNPDSPYHIAPGEKGPASPDELVPAQGDAPPSSTLDSHMDWQHDMAKPSHRMQRMLENSTEGTSAFDDRKPDRKAAEKYALDNGYDPTSFWEQKICWGDLDSFRHLNNVHYVRFLESSRMKWLESLAERAGGTQRRDKMLAGKGISLILKSVSVRYKRPVTYPDTLLVFAKPQNFSPTQFTLASVAYSYNQRAVVTTASAECVWYDYDALQKTTIPKDMELLLKEYMMTGLFNSVSDAFQVEKV